MHAPQHPTTRIPLPHQRLRLPQSPFARQHHAQRYPLMHVPLPHPQCHDRAAGQTRERHGGAFEVFTLAGGVFREHGDGDVEAGEARERGEDVEGEEEGVEGRAEAEGEGEAGGGEAECDLWGLVRGRGGGVIMVEAYQIS